jgi:hypothetical protein
MYSIPLHVAAVYFSHNRLGILVYEESEKEEIFLLMMAEIKNRKM